MTESQLCAHCGGMMLLEVGLEPGEPDEMKCVSCGRASRIVRERARRAAEAIAQAEERAGEGKQRRRPPSHGKLRL